MGLNLKSILVLDGVGQNCTDILTSHGIQVTNLKQLSKKDLLLEISVRT